MVISQQRTAATAQSSSSSSTQTKTPRTAAQLADGALNVDFDADTASAELDELEVPEETLISIRANEILAGVWVEMNARMASKSTSKAEFFESNMHRALGLAATELNAKRDKLKLTEVTPQLIVLVDAGSNDDYFNFYHNSCKMRLFC